jgi:hypothetical protein
MEEDDGSGERSLRCIANRSQKDQISDLPSHERSEMGFRFRAFYFGREAWIPKRRKIWATVKLV